MEILIGLFQIKLLHLVLQAIT